MKVGDLVRVVWQDAYGATPSWDDGEGLDIEIIYSVGYVWRVTERLVVIAPHVTMDRRAMTGALAIPRVCIVRTEVLSADTEEGREPQ